jgi:hypothetical protein
MMELGLYTVAGLRPDPASGLTVSRSASSRMAYITPILSLPTASTTVRSRTRVVSSARRSGPRPSGSRARFSAGAEEIPAIHGWGGLCGLTDCTNELV